MPTPGYHAGSGDAGSDSASDPNIKFSVPLASVAKSTQKLHVSNIPPNMEESGLRYIFGQFGEISSVFLKNVGTHAQARENTTWAFVTFDDPLAAMTAMEKVNMNGMFGLQVKLAMSEQEKCDKRMAEDEKEMVDAEQQRRIEAFERTQGIGRQEYPVSDALGGPMEGKAFQLKKCAKTRVQPRPASGFAAYEKNPEVSDFSPYELQYREDDLRMPNQGSSVSNIDESKLKPFVLNGRTLPCMTPAVPPAERKKCSYRPCPNIGQVRCARCKSWYCSQRCQINDWQDHKLDCEAPPPLEKPDGTPYRQPSQNLRLSSANLAFSVKPSSVSPPHQLHNATMPELNEKLSNELGRQKNNAAMTPISAVKRLSPPLIKPNDHSTPKIIDVVPKAKESRDKDSLFVQSVYRKTVLDNAKVGAIIQIIANIDPVGGSKGKGKVQSTSSPAVFSGTCFQDQDQDLPVLDYVLGTLQDENRLSKLKPLDQLDEQALKVFEVGNLVIAFDEVENAFSRYIYLKTDPKLKIAALFNIDSPKEVENVPFGKIVPAESDAYAHPSLGFQFEAIEEMSDTIERRVQHIADNEAFEAKIVYIKKFEDGRLKHMTAVLLNQDRNPIITYKVTPYFMNSKLSKLLNVQSVTMEASVLKSVELSKGDQVHGIWDATVKFGQWSDLLVVMRVQDVERRDQLQQMLQKSCANAPPIALGEDSSTKMQQLRGQLVACKSSKDGVYYRAVITGAKQDKARLNFVDFGNIEVEDWKNVVDPPEAAKKLIYPRFVKWVRLDDMPNAVEYAKDMKLKSKLTQLQPIFESPFEITKISETNGNYGASTDDRMKYVLVHPNGKTIQQIIQGKLNEQGEQVSKGDVQGATVEGLFDYNKCHFAELKVVEKGCEKLELDVVILNVESPSQIFVCPSNQIGLAEHLQDQIRAYVAAVGKNYLGAAPIPNHLCIAKSSDDDQWYRAACCQEKGQDVYELIFVDYGNVENVSRKNIMHMTPEIMKTPLLANHCVLEGFEDPNQSELYEKAFGKKTQELLPIFKETKILVVKKLPNTGTYVVRIPHIAKSISVELLHKNEAKTDCQKDSQAQPSNISKGDKPKRPEVVLNESKDSQCDKEVEKILSSMECVAISNGDDIVPSSFGKSSNIVFAQRIKDAEQLEQIGCVLKEKCVGLKAIDHTNLKEAIQRKEIVACKWSEDNEYYRAQVTEMNEDAKYVNVLFVDYGNVEKEAVQNITMLPNEAKEFLIYGKFLNLEGVPNIELKDLTTKQMEDLDALVEADFKITSVNNDKVVLTSNDGTTLNDKITKVLASSNVGKSPSTLGCVSMSNGDDILPSSFGKSANIVFAQRLKDADQMEQIGSILKKNCVGLKAVNHAKLKEVIQTKEIVACKWSEDNEYYRAQVTDMKEDSILVNVLFVDYGNVEWEAVQNIMKLPEEAKTFLIYGKFLYLEGVPNTDMKDITIKQTEDMAALVEADFKITLVNDDKVVLTSNDGTTLNDKINKVLAIDGIVKSSTFNSNHGQKEEPKNMIFTKSIPKVNVVSGDQVLALSFGGSADKIQVQRLDDTEKVEKVEVILKAKCSDAKAVTYLPKLGQIVACKWSEDNEFYRAEIMGVQPENKVKVCFIDYGNEEIEALENVMELPQEVVTIPRLATLLTLDSMLSVVQADDKDLGEKLQKLEPKLQEDILKVISIKDDKYVLKMSDGKRLNDFISSELNIHKKRELISKDLTSAENVNELKERLAKEANKRKEDEDKMKAMQEQMKQMQEMLAKMSANQ